MALPCEFVMIGVPVSQQTRDRERRRQWIQDVRGIAALNWDGQAFLDETLMVTITYFYDTVPMDVDNIPKPILDGLKGAVYSDDAQITDLLCRKRSLRDSVLQLPDILQKLDEAPRRFQSFVHILVEHSPNSEALF